MSHKGHTLRALISELGETLRVVDLPAETRWFQKVTATLKDGVPNLEMYKVAYAKKVRVEAAQLFRNGAGRLCGAFRDPPRLPPSRRRRGPISFLGSRVRRHRVERSGSRLQSGHF